MRCSDFLMLLDGPGAIVNEMRNVWGRVVGFGEFLCVFGQILVILAIFMVFLMCQAVSMVRLLSQGIKTLSFGIELQLCYRPTVTWI